jgi:Fe-S cluster assembly ATP-binding protein
MSELKINDLHINLGDKPIVKGVTLTIKPGEVHAVMGPNGTGKSTLAKAIAGHPDYQIVQGDVLLDGKSILGMEADERARAGLFLAFQYPSEIPGVSIANFLRAAVQARMAEGEELDATGYYKRLYSKMDLLRIDRKFTSRSVNEGFSGGEKKRCEILQMAMLEPKYALMDETDSGLDIDALRIVAEGVNALRSSANSPGILLITHYQRLLNYIVPDFVHVMYDGRIVKSGDKHLALELEAKGYDWVKTQLAATPVA